MSGTVNKTNKTDKNQCGDSAQSLLKTAKVNALKYLSDVLSGEEFPDKTKQEAAQTILGVDESNL